MASRSIREDLLAELERLAPEERERVLKYARELPGRKVVGTPGRELLGFFGTLSEDAADEMTAAIEEGCERVDVGEW